MERSMTQAKTALVLVVVFFAGCAASRLIVRPARAGTSPQRWEYACSTVHNESGLEDTANKYGVQGWEMSAAVGSLWCFKRALP
jgi:hypothetical protein